MHRRVEREKRIINIMIKMYCSDIHQSSELCNDCKELKDYAEKKLLNCPFIKNKPVCAKCDIHCYNTQQQEKIKEVMRTVGPKMLYTHSLDTIWYYIYKFTHRYQKIT